MCGPWFLMNLHLNVMQGSPAQSGKIPYIMRGKLAGGLTGTTRFVDQGALSLPSTGMALP